MGVLEAVGLTKRYRRVRALDGCGLSLPEGSVVALVGPNGAGKSTLLNLAVGLRRPTAGTIRVLDRSGIRRTASAGSRSWASRCAARSPRCQEGIRRSSR